MAMKLGILKSVSELDDLVESYRKACEKVGVDYVILDLLSDHWMEEIRNSGIDGILVRTRGTIQEQKSMFDERLYIIQNYLHIPIYPSWKELFFYENKRMYAYYCEANGIPCPKTHVLYRRKDALDYIDTATFPLVFKTNGGSGGSGVDVVRNKCKAKRLVNRIFGRINPRLTIGYIHWGKYHGIPMPKLGMAQKHYVIIQEYVDIKTEWRIFKIGDTYGGYQRPMEHGHGSCELMKYGFPPKVLLNLIKDFCEKEDVGSMSFDVLIDRDDQYYVTEMQTLYGSFSPHQCMVDEVPGRIVFKDNDFVFEPGEDFFLINSNVLRVSDFVNKLSTGYYER